MVFTSPAQHSAGFQGIDSSKGEPMCDIRLVDLTTLVVFAFLSSPRASSRNYHMVNPLQTFCESTFNKLWFLVLSTLRARQPLANCPVS